MHSTWTGVGSAQAGHTYAESLGLLGATGDRLNRYPLDSVPERQTLNSGISRRQTLEALRRRIDKPAVLRSRNPAEGLVTLEEVAPLIVNNTEERRRADRTVRGILAARRLGIALPITVLCAAAHLLRARGRRLLI